jgi:hypothetical protein
MHPAVMKICAGDDMLEYYFKFCHLSPDGKAVFLADIRMSCSR